MSIWKTPISLQALAERSKNTLNEFIGIEFIEIGGNYLKATMPVDHRTHQGIGIMHGGASCVLAETVGSFAANFVVDINTHYCVGLDINTNHLSSIKSGYVIATAKPFHLGRSTQVWGIDIHANEEGGRLISVSRLTVAVLVR